MKRKAAPFQPPKITCFSKFRLKDPEIVHIQLTKCKIFLCTPCNPRQGLVLWATMLGLLPSFTVASAPHVENLPKPIAKQIGVQ